jgi:ATP-dependent DNA helicase RecG
MVDLLTPIEYLKGVGPQRGELLRNELGMHTFSDLLEYYPFRYEDRSKVVAVRELTPQMEYVQLKGYIREPQLVGEGKARRLVAQFRDETGSIELLWFQGANWVRKVIKSDAEFLVYGKVAYFNGIPNISHPELEEFAPEALQDKLKLQPVYSTSEKLKAKGLSSKSIAKITKNLVDMLEARDLPENLPVWVRDKYKLPLRYETLKYIHHPVSEQQAQQAKRRLKFEELFIAQLRICRLKIRHHKSRGWVFDRVGDWFNGFYKEHLPFELTNAQKRVIREVRTDLRSGHQMNRLVQGDVGSGKTMVALLSMLMALDNGFQACLMAPTEILAQQHYASIRQMLEPMGLPVAILTGTVKGAARKQVLRSLADGSVPIVIGTHALLEDTVVFQNLGLAVIDEQHRFGVAQRAQMWKKNRIPPHVLVMTATPIPRTLAMTVYGDLDVSVIDELPPGRKPIQTLHRSEMYRASVMDHVRREIAKGRQIYIVYPLIDESEKMDYESLYEGYEQVKTWFPEPDYRICIVHGKQDATEREQNMDRFVRGLAQILVATTVIEVGVNVPNASVMVIESTERFGLSQLHQLRGRVGRGAEQSYCILLTGNKLSNESRERVQTMVATTDGFVIAEKDLQMRGPGDLEGTRQSGAMNLKMADIVNDYPILEVARDTAMELLEQDIELEKPENACLKAFLSYQHHKNHWSKIS